MGYRACAVVSCRKTHEPAVGRSFLRTLAPQSGGRGIGTLQCLLIRLEGADPAGIPLSIPR